MNLSESNEHAGVAERSFKMLWNDAIDLVLAEQVVSGQPELRAVESGEVPNPVLVRNTTEKRSRLPTLVAQFVPNVSLDECCNFDVAGRWTPERLCQVIELTASAYDVDFANVVEEEDDRATCAVRHSTDAVQNALAFSKADAVAREILHELSD